mmetsp:Transcript_13304/g.35679  ORF Transcript_13304/g.35679 Transcript_13304/m.35679 type:complete len:229 (+) Transcript_13304:467-1153(+)
MRPGHRQSHVAGNRGVEFLAARQSNPTIVWECILDDGAPVIHPAQSPKHLNGWKTLLTVLIHANSPRLVAVQFDNRLAARRPMEAIDVLRDDAEQHAGPLQLRQRAVPNVRLAPPQDAVQLRLEAPALQGLAQETSDVRNLILVVHRPQAARIPVRRHTTRSADTRAGERHDRPVCLEHHVDSVGEFGLLTLAPTKEVGHQRNGSSHVSRVGNAGCEAPLFGARASGA